MLGHMWECRKEHNAASVRIAVTGEGRGPHYRIEYPNPKGSGDPYVFEVYRGSGHREFRDLGQGPGPNSVLQLLGDTPEPKPTTGRDRTIIDLHWSNRAMTFDEVRDRVPFRDVLGVFDFPRGDAAIDALSSFSRDVHDIAGFNAVAVPRGSEGDVQSDIETSE
jgi:hypothetical protein